jgi:hypothetical protein
MRVVFLKGLLFEPILVPMKIQYDKSLKLLKMVQNGDFLLCCVVSLIFLA